jgi:hypothetical protein
MFIGIICNTNVLIIAGKIKRKKVIHLQALKYQPRGRRNIGRPRKRWRDQLHLDDQGTGNMPNPSGT